jgi:glycosyltransferase involved in cell wall biosynthesis
MLKNHLSIITVCYNDKQGLELTLDNISSQTCRDFEYIVIDGASSDGSTDLLVQYSDIIDYRVSEKDTGIYNAMNKGICYAHGEYCLFINAGDTLYAKDTVEKVLPHLHSADYISGHTLCTFADGKITTWKAVNRVTTHLMMIYSLSHQATFIRTRLLKKRLYREDLRIVSDWEQMLYELIIKNGNYKKLDMYICKFAQGGVSSKMLSLREKERKKVLDEYFPEKVQTDIVQANLLVRITSLADEGSFYYKVLEFSARIIRKLLKK